jgi:apolipoprotein N-acyltransferase
VSAKRRKHGVVLAAASGLVFASTSPQSNFTLGVLLGLAGYALSIELIARDGAPHPVRAGALRGFAFGVGANLVALRFVPEVIGRFTPLPLAVGWLALVLLAAAQALPWAIGSATSAWLVRPGEGSIRPPTPAFFAFAIGVYLSTMLPAVFPWTPAGGLARMPVLLQTAELIGERGTSFVVAAACGLVASALIAWRNVGRAALFLVSGFSILLLLVVYGLLRVRDVDALRSAAPHAKVALVEPDFDATFRWDERRAELMIDRLSALTRRAEAAGADLTVWPESAYPYTLAHGVTEQPRGVRAVIQQGVRGPVLTGAYLARGDGLGTNSVILVMPDGTIGPSYDKRHLLWFGETVPLADVFPLLRRVFARGTGLVPGAESVTFDVGPIRLAVLDCYEDTLPLAGREAMAGRPNLLVNATNDAWFAGSAEGELHLRLAVLRAIETRRDLVRAVNRGPTSWIDASGRVLSRDDAPPGLGPPPPLLAEPALISTPPTLYSRAGDRPLVGLVLLVLAVSWLRSAVKQRTETTKA